MSEPSEAAALPANEAQIRDAIWERVGNRTLDEIPTQLGFDPEVKTMGENRILFEDSGVEVTLWLNGARKVSMINVRRL